jgi:hypothetical protein
MKDSVDEEVEGVFDITTTCKFCSEISIPKYAEKIYPNQQLGMGVYKKLLMILELEYQTLPNPKI